LVPKARGWTWRSSGYEWEASLCSGFCTCLC
jgi:hypothetical protein